jgi:membrane-associated phospholipid phosphatase
MLHLSLIKNLFAQLCFCIKLFLQTFDWPTQYILLNTAQHTRRRFFLFTTEFIVVFLLAVSLLLLVYSIHIAFYETEQTLDKKIFNWIAPFQKEPLTGFFRFITFLGGYEFLVPANLLLCAVFLFLKNKEWAFRIPVLALSSLGLKVLLKESIQRMRPPEALLGPASGFSFPSGHALMSMVFYGLLIYISFHTIQNRLFRYSLYFFLSLLILLIGFSRIYLQVHYASDVLAGFSIGCIWLLLSLRLMKKMEVSFKRLSPGSGQ